MRRRAFPDNRAACRPDNDRSNRSQLHSCEALPHWRGKGFRCPEPTRVLSDRSGSGVISRAWWCDFLGATVWFWLHEAVSSYKVYHIRAIEGEIRMMSSGPTDGASAAALIDRDELWAATRC